MIKHNFTRHFKILFVPVVVGKYYFFKGLPDYNILFTHYLTP
jgi:hypothetical protein